MDNIQRRFDLVKNAKNFQRIVKDFGLKTKKVLDLGCGYGEHLVFFGKGSIGLTTDNDEVSIGLSRGLDIRKGNVEYLEETLGGNENFDVIWANNLFEHLLSPHSFLMKLKKTSGPKTTLILGVPVIPTIPFLSKLNRFRGALAVAHTGFYNKKTLILTVEAAGWKVKEARSPYFFNNWFLDKMISVISPFFYIIAENNDNFVYRHKLGEWGSDSHYDYLFKITGQK